MVLMHDLLTRRLNVLYKCMVFVEISLDGYQVIDPTQFCEDKPTTDARWKINMQELWFLYMTRRLNVLYKCMTFR